MYVRRQCEMIFVYLQKKPEEKRKETTPRQSGHTTLKVGSTGATLTIASEIVPERTRSYMASVLPERTLDVLYTTTNNVFVMPSGRIRESRLLTVPFVL